MKSRWGRMIAWVLLFSATPLIRGYQVPADVAKEYTRAEALVHGRQWDAGLAILVPLAAQNADNARILNLTGLALTGEGRIEEADSYFANALRASPGFLPALKNLGINEFGLQQAAEAKGHLAGALEIAPKDPVIHLYLGRLAYQSKEYARAAEMFAAAGDLVFGDANAGAEFAASYLQSGQGEKGVALLGQLSPDHLRARSQLALGVALVQAGFAAQAIAYLQAAHAADPGSNDVAFDLTLCYLNARQYKQAIAGAQELIRGGHETSELDNLLSEAYEADHQTQPAVDALRRAIALDPGNEDNYLDFASLCIDHHAYEGGMKVLEVGLQMHPRSDRLVFERGILYAVQDHFDLAEKDFERAALLAPQKNIGTLGLGVTYLQTGNSQDAVTLLRKKLRETPEDASLLYLLGEALLRAGAVPGDAAHAEAQQALEHSLRLDPGLTQAHVSLGTIYLAENRDTEAVAQLEQAQRLNPKERSAYSHLAIGYRRLGERDKAKEALDVLRTLNDRDRGVSAVKVKGSEAPTGGAGLDTIPR